MIQDKFLVKRIRNILAEAEEMGITDHEIMIQIKDVVPKETVEVEKIVYKEKIPINSKEKLEYMRLWRLEKKKLKKIQEKEDIQKAKIEKALKRVSFFCYTCKKNVIITNPQDNQAQIVQKKNRNKKSINVNNICPYCSNKLNSFGGYVQI